MISTRLSPWRLLSVTDANANWASQVRADIQSSSDCRHPQPNAPTEDTTPRKVPAGVAGQVATPRSRSQVHLVRQLDFGRGNSDTALTRVAALVSSSASSNSVEWDASMTPTSITTAFIAAFVVVHRLTRAACCRGSCGWGGVRR